MSDLTSLTAFVYCAAAVIWLGNVAFVYQGNDPLDAIRDYFSDARGILMSLGLPLIAVGLYHLLAGPVWLGLVLLLAGIALFFSGRPDNPYPLGTTQPPRVDLRDEE